MKNSDMKGDWPWWCRPVSRSEPLPAWHALTETWRRARTRKAPEEGRRIIVFTDPDGTLLDHRAHPCSPACPALAVLGEHDVPIVLCSSRTRAELELIQHEFQFRHPFISENGGAAYLPHGYFTSPDFMEFSGYDVLAFGGPYQQVVEALRLAASTLHIEVRNFHDMSVQEVADECGLSLAEARLTKLREYDEPFRIVASDPAAHRRLVAALRRAGLRCVNDGRFHHVTSGTDLGRSVRALMSAYSRQSGHIFAVGISDGRGDLSLLQEVDVAIVVSSAEVDADRVLRKLPAARVTSKPGSLGWDEAIFSAVVPKLENLSR
ncbi:MAG: HAD hydrolase family protein [Vicinamibacterales bacterium]